MRCFQCTVAYLITSFLPFAICSESSDIVEKREGLFIFGHRLFCEPGEGIVEKIIKLTTLRSNNSAFISTLGVARILVDVRCFALGHRLRVDLHLEAWPILLRVDCMKFQPFLGWRSVSTTHYKKPITWTNFLIWEGHRTKKPSIFNKSNIIQRVCII